MGEFFFLKIIWYYICTCDVYNKMNWWSGGIPDIAELDFRNYSLRLNVAVYHIELQT